MSDIDSFLEKIAEIESASGKHTNHKVMESGMHKGQSAIGTYGLMPKTVDEIAKNSKDKQIKALQELSPEEKKDLLTQNPDLEHKVAKELASKVLSKQDGDEEKAAYSWNQGHNLSSKKIENRDYTSHPYVQKFQKLSNTISPLDIEGTPQEKKVKDYIEHSPSRDTLNLIKGQKEEQLAKLKGLKGSVTLTPEEESLFNEDDFAADYGPEQMATGVGMGRLGAHSAKTTFEKLKGMFGKPKPDQMMDLAKAADAAPSPHLYENPSPGLGTVDLPGENTRRPLSDAPSLTDAEWEKRYPLRPEELAARTPEALAEAARLDIKNKQMSGYQTHTSPFLPEKPLPLLPEPTVPPEIKTKLQLGQNVDFAALQRLIRKNYKP